jgi:hypothetical protein
MIRGISEQPKYVPLWMRNQKHYSWTFSAAFRACSRAFVHHAALSQCFTDWNSAAKHFIIIIINKNLGFSVLEV